MSEGDLTALIERLSRETREHFDTVAKELRGKVAETRQGVDTATESLRSEAVESRQHFDTVTESLRNEVVESRQHFDVVTESLRNEVVESRQHFDVVAEGLRSDVRLVSEGVTTNGERIDRLSKGMRGEFEETNAMIRLSYSELDHRLRTLEQDVAGLQSRVARLEADDPT